VPSGRLRRTSHSPDSASLSSRCPEAMGPAPLAAESCSELAAGVLGRGPGTMPSARNGPQALNFKTPTVTRLVSQAPRLLIGKALRGMAGMVAEEKKALITSSQASVLSSLTWSLRSSLALCL
jgi:hypothetical protein